MRKVGWRIAITLTLVAMTWTVSSQQVKRSIESDAPRIQRAAPADATTLATRQRFLEMFARAYFPGRTGQLLIVPREGDFITRADVAYNEGVHLSIEIDREDDGRWIAEALELPGVMTYGQTREEAISNTERLAIEVIADRIKHSELPPSALNVSFQVLSEQLAGD